MMDEKRRNEYYNFIFHPFSFLSVPLGIVKIFATKTQRTQRA